MITIDHSVYNKNNFTFNSFCMGIGEVKKDVFYFVGSFNSCRGFIGDALAIKKAKANINVCYPLSDKYDINKGDTYVIMKSDTPLKLLTKNLEWLHSLEEKAKVKKSIIHKTQYENTFIIEGSGHWKNSAWKIMLYTYLVKCISYVDPMVGGEYWKQKNVLHNLDQMLKKAKIKTEIFSPDVFIQGEYRQGFHDKEGFVSICGGKNPPMFKLLGLKNE